jgi:uncharacterized membrane protein YeaQ/YmgE (transglycosylase-associated protein family)
MINIFFWIFIGALCGWIGYLATRTEQPGPVKAYLLIGTIGGLLGGLMARLLGFAGESGLVDSNSVFNAFITSALFIILFVVLLNFFKSTSSS